MYTLNDEYYIDNLMGELTELGYKVKVFKIYDYVWWESPDDYETFVYWQSFFHKCDFHPYSLEKDITVDKNKIAELDKKYRSFKQENR